MRPICLALFATFAAAAPAQTETGDRAVGITPQIVVETTGPHGWRMRLGPTNLGSLLSSADGREFWEPQLLPVMSMWRGLLGDEQRFGRARERLLAYEGTIRLAVHHSRAGRWDVTRHVALVLEGDGRTSLGDLAGELGELITSGVPGGWRTIELDGTERRLRGDEQYVVSEPHVDGGRLVVLAGPPDGIATSDRLARALRDRPVTIGPKHPTGPALRIDIDAPACLAASNLFADADTKRIAAALGFSSLDRITMKVGTAGPRVLVDVEVAFGDGERGIFDALMPQSRGVPSLSRLLPAEATGWKVGRFDCHALAKALFDAIETEGAGDEDARQTVRDELGFDLERDLLIHISDEVLALASPLLRFDRWHESTWLWAFGLRDQQKFAPVFEKLLAAAGPLLDQAESVDVDGVALRRFGNLLRYDIWIGVGNGLLVVSGGRDAEEEATAVLQQAKRPDRGEGGGLQVDDLRAHLPDGVNGLAQLDLDSVAGLSSWWWSEMVEELMPFAPPLADDAELEQLEQQRERLRALLRKQNLNLVRTATGHAEGAWRWRLFW